MPVVFDFKCTKCGHLIRDYLLRNSKDKVPKCPICEEQMEKQFTGFSTPHGKRHHHQLPSDYKFSEGGASFGKV